MNETELKNILDQATAKVLRNLPNAQGVLLTAEEANSTDAVTVVLVPSIVPFKEKAFAQLKEAYGSGLVYVAFDARFTAAGQRVLPVKADHEETILSMVEGATNVILLAPTLGTIGNITEGSDEGLLEYLFLRARLWEKNVAVFVDFDLPNHKRGKFGDIVSARLDALRHLEIPAVNYRTEAFVKEMTETVETRDLITEREVMEDYAAGRGRVICRADAIITPLAWEKAGDLGITIERREVL